MGKLDSLSKYANLATIITVAIMLASGLLVGDRKLRAMEVGIAAATTAAKTAMAAAMLEREKNEKQDQVLEQLTKILTKQAQQVDGIYKRGLIIPKGKAFVMEAAGEAYIELNLLDVGASRLKDFNVLKVTNMSHPDRPSATIRVGPSFTNTTPDYVMQLSTEAGLLLHANIDTWIQIRVEPIFEEE